MADEENSIPASTREPDVILGRLREAEIDRARERAQDQLFALGELVRPFAERFLSNGGEPPQARAAVAEVLGALGPVPSLPALLVASADIEPRVRAAAVLSLGGAFAQPEVAGRVRLIAETDVDEVVRQEAQSILRRHELPSSIFGEWPGDEGDETVFAALEQLS